jgi:hypothetical protein
MTNTQEGMTFPANGGNIPDTAHEQTKPTCGPAEPVGSLSSYRHTAVDAPPSDHPQPEPLLRSSEVAQPCPLGRRRHQPLRHPAAKQHRCCHLVTRCCATLQGALPPEPP